MPFYLQDIPIANVASILEKVGSLKCLSFVQVDLLTATKLIRSNSCVKEGMEQKHCFDSYFNKMDDFKIIEKKKIAEGIKWRSNLLDLVQHRRNHLLTQPMHSQHLANFNSLIELYKTRIRESEIKLSLIKRDKEEALENYRKSSWCRFIVVSS